MNIIINTALSYVHKNPPVRETIEQSITDLEIESMEHDRSLTDVEIDVMELQEALNNSKS